MANIEMDFHNKVDLRGNKAATFNIADNEGNSLGRLRLGRGYVRYFKPGKGPHRPVKLTWERFVELLESKAEV